MRILFYYMRKAITNAKTSGCRRRRFSGIFVTKLKLLQSQIWFADKRFSFFLSWLLYEVEARKSQLERQVEIFQENNKQEYIDGERRCALYEITTTEDDKQLVAVVSST